MGGRYLIRFVKKLRNWWPEFLNHLDDQVTQGFVEDVDRASRGLSTLSLASVTSMTPACGS